MLLFVGLVVCLVFFLNLKINVGYWDISIPFHLYVSFHTQRCSFRRYSSNISSFHLESQIGCNPPVPFFGLFCHHWRPPGRDCGTVLTLHIFLVLGFYTGQFVETIKVYVIFGDYICSFIRCSDFTAHWVFSACQILILDSVVSDFNKISFSVFSYPKSVKEMIKPKFSFCMLKIYICMLLWSYL